MLKIRNDWSLLPYAVLGGIALLAIHFIRKRRKEDDHYLQQCHRLRKALSKPRHSNFRVVALLLLEDGTTIFGANDEASPTISGAICAERGALMQYRVVYGAQSSNRSAPKINTVYVVSDHPSIHITPGCLCREYLYGHPAIDLANTRVVLQSQDPLSQPETWSVPQLYPFASPTARLTHQLAMKVSKNYEGELKILMNQPHPPFQVPETSIHWQHIQKIYRMACAAARAFDSHDNVYPIRLAAASGGEAMEPITAVQVPALEYGCTRDVVSQVLQQQSGADLFVVQVDQWGLPHAPYAVARSAICEISQNQRIYVLVGMPLRIVQGTDLYPTMPTIF